MVDRKRHGKLESRRKVSYKGVAANNKKDNLPPLSGQTIMKKKNMHHTKISKEVAYAILKWADGIDKRIAKGREIPCTIKEYRDLRRMAQRAVNFHESLER